MPDVKIVGDVVYPEASTRWVDNQDDSRTLWIKEVDPGDRLGREIRGTIESLGSPHRHDGRPYATDIRTFNGVWLPLGVPVANS